MQVFKIGLGCGMDWPTLFSKEGATEDEFLRDVEEVLDESIGEAILRQDFKFFTTAQVTLCRGLWKRGWKSVDVFQVNYREGTLSVGDDTGREVKLSKWQEYAEMYRMAGYA